MNILSAIIERIDRSKNIVLTAHKSPDGDSIGSSMAMYQYLKTLDKKVLVCHPDPCPNYLTWVENVGEILNYEEQAEQVAKALSEAELIFALDYNHPSRIGDMTPLLADSKEKLVMIDHHLNPADFVSLAYSKPETCSTAELVYELIHADSRVEMNERIGTPIYLGLLTDSGSFRFNSVVARTHEIVADLLNSGVNHTRIHESVFDQNSINQIRLKSYALNQKLELLHDNQVALISLTEEELNNFNYQKGDTEGLVNTGLSIKGIRMSILLQQKGDAIKMSMRSKKEVYVNQLAADHFDGGGHAYASGGISHDTMENTLNKLRSVVANYL